MKIVFQGKSNEYEIEKSHFCNRAFIVKDKVINRDEVNLITDSVEILEFNDDSFKFDEILEHLQEENSENTIFIEDYFNENNTLMISDKSETKELLDQDKNNNYLKNTIKFEPSNTFSRFFSNANFILNSNICEQRENINLPKDDKLEIFKNLKNKDLDISFVKLEFLNYDNHNDSLSFNLEVFPSGASYKYGLSQNTMYMILQGKFSSASLFNFLKSFVYKSKAQNICEKTFILMLNHKLVYELKVSLI